MSKRGNNLQLVQSNWRRDLLLTHTGSRDVDAPVDYITINETKIPVKLARFCKENWSKFSFDYDTSSLLLWPTDDARLASELVKEINKVYPRAATCVKKAPSSVHNLELDGDTEVTFDLKGLPPGCSLELE